MIPVMEFRNAVQAHLEAADEIVAISRSAAEDISAYFPHIRKPVHVVPCGIVEADFDAPSLSSSLHADFSIDISMPMFTLIGFHEPSKNVANAISALIDVSERIGREVQAFIIGPSDGIDLYERFGPAAKRLSGRVRIIFGGSVSDTVKRAVLKKSIALIYVSKWEGFGIPPLEAMALGTQVVASDIAPLKEVCGILPEYCDPYDVQDIGAAILRTILKSPEERSAYAERARNHAQSFMWKAAVEKLYRVTIAPASSV
jgi:glycosyltransferase involved in cell wall biosynthesis